MSPPAERLAATAAHLSPPSSTSVSAQSPINNVTVFGAGLMGAGIAQVSAQNGYKVILCDVSQDLVDKGLDRIIRSWIRTAKEKFNNDPSKQYQYVKTFQGNIRVITDSTEAVKDADLVIEAIIENLKIKQDLFSTLDKTAKKSCLFATNTSSLSVTEIGASLSGERKKQFGGLHFFNPVTMMQLLEVIRTRDTSDTTFNAFLGYGRGIRKQTVVCKDTQGFIVNRLLVPYLRDAVQMMDRGDASAEDIDTAMRLGAGHPIGPLALADLIGLDTVKYISDAWKEGTEMNGPIIPDEGSGSLAKLVSEGKLGRKSGEGFFKYK